ncbi:DUF3293 domain-containing protein [Rhodanobacter sp. L36]|uniref:DUF3293 domain-containing protein n=1 Tax=Rhodanobacter sp. L36 TaxID=1747221 RepID=UPI0020B17237|nr:DUF3293 domain-containing protein [Rhodanobacter sp. L36]
MTEDFTTAYNGTDYRVRLSRGGYATIRIGAPLPPALREHVGTQPWGFITAWNPHGLRQNRLANRVAQRQLADALKALPSTVAILPAVGVGDAWQEPSLFVVGPDVASLNAFAVLYEQLAWVYGDDLGLARLRWTHD